MNPGAVGATSVKAVPVTLQAQVSALQLAAASGSPGPLTDVGSVATITVSWQPVPGATGAEVSACSVRITPTAVDETIGPLSTSASGRSRIVTLPSQRRVRRLVLDGLRRKAGGGWRDVRSSADLDEGSRLAVGVATGGDFGPPLYAVPHLTGGQLQPPLLAGATVTAGPAAVLNLPDVPATRVRLSIVSGAAPEDFEQLEMQLGGVTVVAAVPPADLVIAGPDGATVWSMPGEVPASSPALVADLRVAAEAALAAAVTDGLAPSVALRLSGRTRSHVYLRGPVVKGALLRSFPGVLPTTVAGGPERVAGVTGLAAEVPSSATADLTVRYDGFRLLPAPFSDAVPAPRASVSGPVVSADGTAVLRPFPPAGFGDHALARIGLVGRAAEDASLSVTVVALRPDGGAGDALGPPAVVDVAAGSVLDVVWADLPAPVASPSAPASLSVRATAGTFLWAASPEGRPLARLAVRDDDPAPAPVTLDGTALCEVGKDGLHDPARALPQTSFAGATPVLDCTLFVSVDLSDLVLRYAR